MPKMPRYCPRCKKDVLWIKDRPEGGRRSRFLCIHCDGITKPLSGRKKKKYRTPTQNERRQKMTRANDLWRHLIYKKARPTGACAVCGTTRGLQAMHLFPKGKYPHIRFDLDNGAPGCPGCHIRLTNDHEAHRDFCIRFLGAEKYEQLRLRSLCKTKMDIDLVLMHLQRETDAGKADGEKRLPEGHDCT